LLNKSSEAAGSAIDEWLREKNERAPALSLLNKSSEAASSAIDAWLRKK